MTMLLLASIVTTAAVSVVCTAVLATAAKNQIVQHQLQYWETRAMRAERPGWRA
jgi:hypothetical protein